MGITREKRREKGKIEQHNGEMAEKGADGRAEHAHPLPAEQHPCGDELDSRADQHRKQRQMRAAISLKHRHRTTKSYPMILRSIASKNRYVTRIMVWCDANDTHQIALLKAAATATDTIATKSFEVCPTCGYISQQEPSTPICPQCRTVATTFVRF